MKWKDLITDFRPSHKLGAESIALGILGGTGVLNSLLGYASSQQISSQHIAAQKQENQLNRDWQTLEAEKARAWSSQMTDKQNAWNSPQNQVKMLQQANINPAVAFGSGSGTVSAASVPTGEMPQSVQGLTPVPGQPFDLRLGELGQLMKNLGEAKKLGIDTKYAEASFDLNLESLLQEVNARTLSNAGLKLDNTLKKFKLPHDVKIAYEAAKKASYDALVSQQTVGYVKNQSELAKTQANLNKALEQLNSDQSQLLKLDIANYNSKLNSFLKLQSAQASEANAKAVEAAAQAQQTKLFNKVYGDKRFQHSLISQAVSASQTAIEQGKLTKRQADQMKYLVEQAAYATSMQEFTYWSDQVNKFVSTVGQAASQFYGAGALRELIKLRGAMSDKTFDPNAGRGYQMENGHLVINPVR